VGAAVRTELTVKLVVRVAVQVVRVVQRLLVVQH
jgi:hypothetical protein